MSRTTPLSTPPDPAPVRAVDRPQTKRDKSEASIDRILESALSLIVTRGFNATTVDDIARNAGLTKGAIYFHFENKTAILLALLDVIDKLVLGSLMDRVMHAGPTSKDKLVAALHSQGMLAETKTKYLLLFTLTLLEFNGTDTPIETRVKAIYDGFVQTLEKIVRTGRLRANSVTISTRAMASVVMALQHGTLMEWYCRSGTLNARGRCARHGWCCSTASCTAPAFPRTATADRSKGKSPGDLGGDRQARRQSWRLDAEQVHQTGDAMRLGSLLHEVARHAPGPCSFGRTPLYAGTSVPSSSPGQ